MGHKKDKLATRTETPPVVSEDQLINELMEKRKLQQDALIKIMTSMDKTESESTEVPRPVKIQRKLSGKKIFKIRKKSSK